MCIRDRVGAGGPAGGVDPALLPAGVEHLGADSIVVCDIDGQEIAIRQDGFVRTSTGESVNVAWDAANEHHFDQVSGRRIEKRANHAA